MSEHSLPEDLSQWPDSPFELLGVTPQTPPKDLKRTYTRLIKVYKPERFPEHFRRIREAYESVLRYVELFAGAEFIAAPIETETTPPPETLGEPKADEPVIAGAETPRPVTPDDMADLWERAIRGEEAEAYRGLLRLHGERPHQTAICLRLYWLLALDPDLDAERRPCEWLVAGLKSSGLGGPSLELFRREIEADPGEAFTAGFDELLEVDAVPSALAELYVWRWMAVRRVELWDALAEDLPRAKERIGRFDDGAWLRLLLIAADGAAWIPLGTTSVDIWWKVVEEIEQVSNLGPRYADWLDRFDFLRSVRDEWQKANASAPVMAIRHLVGRAWNAPLLHYRQAFWEVLERIEADPSAWVGHFDALRNLYPALLAAFGELLRQAEYRAELPRPDSEVMARITGTFIAAFAFTTESIRAYLVRFCIREAIDPIWMVESVAGKDVAWNSAIDPQVFFNLQEDYSVRYVCLAHRLFWA
jgi:hypothetical protein